MNDANTMARPPARMAMRATPAFDVRLVRTERVAENTLAFHFSRPDGFSFHAGQSVRLMLFRPLAADKRARIHTFTLASAPCETGLTVVTRLRDSPFKRALAAAPAGTRFGMDEPDGELVLLRNPTRPLVFLAGGIGVTPFLSILRQAVHDALSQRIHLFYSNRRPQLAPFLPELCAMQRSHPDWHLIATMTAAGPFAQPWSWSGERGHISRELLERHLPDLREPMYYLAGSPAMTTAMMAMLEDSGVSDAAIRSAEFHGY